MSHVEFEAWANFYALQPFDDLHRFHRPAALVAVSLGGGTVAERLDWLQPEPTVGHGEYNDADLNTMKAFGFKPPKE